MTGEGTSYEDIVIVDYLAEENYGLLSARVLIFVRKSTRFSTIFGGRYNGCIG